MRSPFDDGCVGSAQLHDPDRDLIWIEERRELSDACDFHSRNDHRRARLDSVAQRASEILDTKIAVESRLRDAGWASHQAAVGLRARLDERLLRPRGNKGPIEHVRIERLRWLGIAHHQLPVAKWIQHDLG